MGEFRMPSLGADMESGTIVEWKVGPGDVVHRGDVVAVIDTDKADIDAEIFEEGRIEALVVGVGDKVPVGTVLATITSADGPVVPPAATPVVEIASSQPKVEIVSSERAAVAEPEHHALPPVLSPVVRHLAERAGLDVAVIDGSGPGGRVMRSDVEAAARARSTRPRVSPRARRLAAEHGVDLDAVATSGAPVTGHDVEAATRAAAPVQEAPRDDRSASMQRRIALTMERSNREIPHYYVSHDCDMANALAWQDQHNAERPPGERVVTAALLLAATARGAAEVPGFNGWWVDDAFQPAQTVDLGFIVSMRDGGLLAPVIAGADALDVSEVMGKMHDLVNRARSGHLRSSDLGTPTITVSNLGDQGADSVLGVIYPPQVALVGFGRTLDRPWAKDGLLGVRPVVTISVAADHRASDGHRASRFVACIDRVLQSPDSLERTTT